MECPSWFARGDGDGGGGGGNGEVEEMVACEKVGLRFKVGLDVR